MRFALVVSAGILLTALVDAPAFAAVGPTTGQALAGEHGASTPTLLVSDTFIRVAAAPCLPPGEVWNGKCVPKCPPGLVHTMPDGACGLPPFPLPVLCLQPNEIWNGKCVPKCPLGLVHTVPAGACGPPPFPLPVLCLPPKELWNNKCLPKCPQGAVHMLPNGVCSQPPVMAPRNPIPIPR
ncbi:MAG: hypothetical protein WD036_00820 [Bauldia sp.]